MKVTLLIWILAVFVREVVPGAIIRHPQDLEPDDAPEPRARSPADRAPRSRRQAVEPHSSVQTEYEAKYQQKGHQGNESFSTVKGRQEIVHSNCSENWSEFAEKCATLIKDLVASLANAISSSPGDTTNLQLQIKNSFRHFDSSNNCSCFNRSKSNFTNISLDLPSLFNGSSSTLTITRDGETLQASQSADGHATITKEPSQMMLKPGVWHINLDEISQPHPDGAIGAGGQIPNESFDSEKLVPGEKVGNDMIPILPQGKGITSISGTQNHLPSPVDQSRKPIESQFLGAGGTPLSDGASQEMTKESDLTPTASLSHAPIDTIQNAGASLPERSSHIEGLPPHFLHDSIKKDISDQLNDRNPAFPPNQLDESPSLNEFADPSTKISTSNLNSDSPLTPFQPSPSSTISSASLSLDSSINPVLKPSESGSASETAGSLPFGGPNLPVPTITPLAADLNVRIPDANGSEKKDADFDERPMQLPGGIQSSSEISMPEFAITKTPGSLEALSLGSHKPDSLTSFETSSKENAFLQTPPVGVNLEGQIADRPLAVSEHSAGGALPQDLSGASVPRESSESFKPKISPKMPLAEPIEPLFPPAKTKSGISGFQNIPDSLQEHQSGEFSKPNISPTQHLTDLFESRFPPAKKQPELPGLPNQEDSSQEQQLEGLSKPKISPTQQLTQLMESRFSAAQQPKESSASDSTVAKNVFGPSIMHDGDLMQQSAEKSLLKTSKDTPGVLPATIPGAPDLASTPAMMNSGESLETQNSPDLSKMQNLGGIVLDSLPKDISGSHHFMPVSLDPLAIENLKKSPTSDFADPSSDKGSVKPNIVVPLIISGNQKPGESAETEPRDNSVSRLEPELAAPLPPQIQGLPNDRKFSEDHLPELTDPEQLTNNLPPPLSVDAAKTHGVLMPDFGISPEDKSLGEVSPKPSLDISWNDNVPITKPVSSLKEEVTQQPTSVNGDLNQGGANVFSPPFTNPITPPPFAAPSPGQEILPGLAPPPPGLLPPPQKGINVPPQSLQAGQGDSSNPSLPTFPQIPTQSQSQSQTGKDLPEMWLKEPGQTKDKPHESDSKITDSWPDEYGEYEITTPPKPTTYQTTSVEPTSPQSHISSVPKSPFLPDLDNVPEDLPAALPSLHPTQKHPHHNKSFPVEDDEEEEDQEEDEEEFYDIDDEDDCCNCESCTDQQLENRRKFRTNACKDLDDAKRQLKVIFEKIRKNLKCGKKASKPIFTSSTPFGS